MSNEIISFIITESASKYVESASVFHIIPYNIYLDGISIKDNVSSLSISCSESSVHNSIEFSSINRELFNRANPNELSGSGRIEVHVGNRVLIFLVEQREGDEQEFSIWGRGLSALQDSPYAENIDYSLASPKLASEVVADIATCAVDWECDDWVLPIDFEFNGPPIEGISTIAAAAGFVVRSNDDGSIKIRPRFPVRPIDMADAQAAVNYDRSNLLSLSFSETKGEQFNTIEVLGWTPDIDSPQIELEEDSPEQGDTVHIRVFWSGDVERSVETYVTDGIIIDLGMSEDVIEQVITFEEGNANTDYPIDSIESIEWEGDSGTGLTFVKNTNELTIDDEAYRVAKIKYSVRFQRYRLSEHDVETLIAVLSTQQSLGVSVLVTIGNSEGDNPMDSISDPLLTDKNIAIIRGTAELDNSRYNKKTVTLVAPYNENAVDGVLGYFNNAEIDCLGNFHVIRSDLKFEGPKVTNEMEVVQCRF